MDEAWLDISIVRCPNCGRYYADASWYTVELESDVECGGCRQVFNAKKQLTDRVMVKLRVDDRGRALESELVER